MPNTNIVFVGSRWGRVTCVSKGNETDRIDLGGGVVETRTQERLGFRCDCGVEFKVWGSEFRGKRHIRDCGKCGLGGVVGEGKVMISAQVEVSTVEFLKREAGLRGVSFSQLLKDVLRAHKERTDLPKIEAKPSEVEKPVVEPVQETSKRKSRIW